MQTLFKIFMTSLIVRLFRLRICFVSVAVMIIIRKLFALSYEIFLHRFIYNGRLLIMAERFENILIATDGSVHSIRAARAGIELAKLSGGKVTGLYVVDTNRALSDVSSNIANEVFQGLKATMKKEGEHATNYVEESAKMANITVEKKIVEGNPAEEILKMSGGMDVVVIGSIGRTGLDKYLLGSVTDKVVRNSKVPVLVVY
jgi:nucleotide-binding universal stress UspA family protein